MGVRLAHWALAAGLIAVGPARGAFAESSEAELKAEFIERFTRFIDWADADVAGDQFVLCIHGESTITTYLEQIARRRKLRGRDMTVDIVDDPAAVTDCQLVLIGGSDRKRLRAVLAHTEGRPILTIADAPGAAAAGAIINFYRDDNHVRFEINTRAAKDSGLRIRAKLLRLARLVRQVEGG
jgi:hypothetical protein